MSKWNIIYRTSDTEEFIKNEIIKWNKLLNQLQQTALIDFEIKKIVVSETYARECELYSDSDSPITPKRGFYSMAKIFDKEDGKVLLFDRKYILFNNPESIQIIIGQFVDTKVPNITKKLYPNLEGIKTKCYKLGKVDIGRIFESLLMEQVKTVMLKQQKFQFDGEPYNALLTGLSHFNEVEKSLYREIKKAHYQYQKNNNLEQLWNTIINNISFHLNRLILTKSDTIPPEHPLEKLFQLFSRKLPNNEKNETIINNWESALVDFFATQNFSLSPTFDGQYNLKILEDPKIFYDKYKIVDTEKRVVCFLDTLGFKEMINEYDSDANSTILQDYKKAIDEAYQTTLHNFAKSSNFEYQSFSDCIVISIPYFSDDDLQTQLFVMMQAVKSFSVQLFYKNFFVRGGISLGSFYSDENMIFSGGLVRAYKLESKDAVYPRVILDNKIVEILSNYTNKEKNSFPWDKTFVKDNLDEEIFINLFEDVLDPTKPLKYMQKVQSDSVGEFPDDEILSKVSDFAQDLLKNSIEMVSERVDKKEIIASINDIINSEIAKTASDKNIKKKYLWLLQLVEWLNDENQNYSFFLENEK